MARSLVAPDSYDGDVDLRCDNDFPTRAEVSQSYDPFGSPSGSATLGAEGCVEVDLAPIARDREGRSRSRSPVSFCEHLVLPRQLPRITGPIAMHST